MCRRSHFFICGRQRGEIVEVMRRVGPLARNVAEWARNRDRFWLVLALAQVTTGTGCQGCGTTVLARDEVKPLVIMIGA
ncbi:hypothetical protein BT69DRAFT_36575 [Atractiella rhizophila]|nr:hypothetical protein BT69DRAFT_36575 [Atractiella rhizophila]